jgi:hypothetical protein
MHSKGRKCAPGTDAGAHPEAGIIFVRSLQPPDQLGLPAAHARPLPGRPACCTTPRAGT